MKRIILLWTLGSITCFALYLALAGGNTPRLTLHTWAAGFACFVPAIIVTALHRKRP